jgi:hypothetical protein
MREEDELEPQMSYEQLGRERFRDPGAKLVERIDLFLLMIVMMSARRTDVNNSSSRKVHL